MALIVCFLAFKMALLEKVLAQKLDLGASRTENFRVAPIFYPGTTQKQLMLRGQQAQPQGPNQLRIKSLRIETYYRSGATNLIMEAPQCLYHTVWQTVSSDGPLQVTSGDERFSLAGQKGFVFQQTNNTLVVSNQVRVLVSKPRGTRDPSRWVIQTQAPSGPSNPLAPQEPPVLIECDQGTEWDFNAGLAVFRGNVRVTDEPGFKLRSELLMVHFNPGGATNQVSRATSLATLATNQPIPALGGTMEANLRLEKIIAERDVDIHFRMETNQTGRALCDHVIYTATNDLVTLTHVKRIDLPQGIITASTLYWDRHNSKWSCPPSSPFRFNARPGLFASSGTNRSSEQGLSIQCKNGTDWDFNTGRAVFRGDVRVIDEADFDLSSEWLTVHFNPSGATNGTTRSASLAAHTTNRPPDALGGLEKIIAEGEVDIHFRTGTIQTGRALCHQVVYTATNELATFSEVKRIDLPQGSITASTLLWDRRNNKWSCPPSSPFQFNAKAGLFASRGAHQSPEQTFSIRCENGTDWDFNAGQAVFRGNVRVTDEPDFDLRSEFLTIHFNPGAATNEMSGETPMASLATNRPASAWGGSLGANLRLEKIIAEREVDIHFRMGTNQTGRALCGHVVYTAANDLVILTQIDQIKTPHGIITADTVLYNLRTRKFVTPPGRYLFDASSILPNLFQGKRSNQFKPLIHNR